MSGRDESTDDDPTGGRPEADDDSGDRRRPRPDDRLGDLLPDVTLDELATGWGDDDADPDERLTREVPPHHG